MARPSTVARLCAAAALITGAGTTCSQDYPNKPVRVVTYPAGGGTDFSARLIAQGLSVALGQQFIVDNRPGGVIQGEILAKAAPDGYTLLLNGSALWLAPFMQEVAYNPRDFSPVTLATISPNVLVVHPSVPAASVKELIAVARARPGALNYASGPAGVPNHLAAELFKSLAGVDIVRIGYKGGGPALNDLIAGQVQLLFASAGTVMPHVRSGRLRALAITSAQPSALVPDMPTIAASGLPGYEIVSIDAVFAPGKTSAAIIGRLNREILRVLNRPDVKEKFFNAGVETVGSSPEELATRLKSEMARLGKLIKDAGIHSE